ncbi:PREDICTED: 26S proteasome non-ATPase regulatory subunit 1-like, partial [Rhagoletis zephyria]|uniref:26S proteasome non-ATPase regulatory subunit 1-like n=1 Tax=Rhagoletis zephyria TaxID=28612 RepID=UPI0008113B95
MQPRLQLTSAAGIISLLDDSLPEMKIFALERLNSVVDEFWAEISEVVPKIEILYEDESFPHRQLAALVASKVYYHLGSFEDSLTYALGAGSLFNVTATSEYVETIVSKSIDHYIKLRALRAAAASATNADKPPIDSRLEDIVNRMFQRCFEDGQFKQAIGIALETRRMDVFEQAILHSNDLQAMLAYAFKITMSLIDNLHFRDQVLKILVNLYRNLQVPDYINMVQCLIFLDDDKAIAELLDKLTRQSHDKALMAYQIAFDLYESATQQFLARITESLRLAAPIASLISPKKPIIAPGASSSSSSSSSAAAAAAASTAAEPEKMETDTPPAASSSSPSDIKPSEPLKKEDLSEEDKRRQERLENLAKILTGDTSIELDLQFLIRNNKTDLLVLKSTKEAVRNSVCHNATVIANGLMHCGTTSDQFLRDNLDWLARAVNWAKFSATASLGVIHKRHEKEALHLMASYLPKDNGPGSGYTEGGGLYALGLIHANHGGGGIVDYLLNQLKGATNEAVKHGGCLGLGLAAMGSHRNDVYEQLKCNLYQDDAVTGEAAGIAMGLVMLGSK